MTETEKLKISNIVCTFGTECKINLKDIAQRARNVEYNPKRFPACVMRIRNSPSHSHVITESDRFKTPGSTALIFATGKLVVTGTKSLYDANIACRKFARVLQKLGYGVKISNMKVQNIVATFDYRKPISLEVLQVAHPKFCTYEPELFPGLTWRIIGKSNVVLLMFKSGKVVITGSKTIEETIDAHRNICTILPQFTRRLK